MGLTFGCDDSGPFGSLFCDEVKCEAHVSVRPYVPADTLDAAVDLADALADFASQDGWWLVGWTSCPRHTLGMMARYGLTVAITAPGAPEEPTEPVKPGAAAAVAQRGLTGVH